MNRIGIDVGGTNTDAVLMHGTGVACAVKAPTTVDVTSGIVNALQLLVREAGGTLESVDAVMIGTTHFTNAVVRRKDLTPVAAIRVGLPASASLPPFVDWPRDLTDMIRGPVILIRGGHEYDGRPIVEFDARAVYDCAARIRDAGVNSVAVSAVFSPLTSECEDRTEEILREVIPDVSVTKSSALGRIGLLERENAALLNACLIDLARRTFRSFVDAIRYSGIEAPLFITQNDGTVMDAKFAERYPVLSFASGPTNSMRGAALLSGVTDALVADVGGTTTDIGCLKSGFPREANNVVDIGGVRTAFRMPDVLSIGLGGGSIVDLETGTFGPESVGHRIAERAVVFGGRTMTATDIGVRKGLIILGERARAADLSLAQCERVWSRMVEFITTNVDKVKTSVADEMLIAVGGAAFLMPDQLPGIDSVIRVGHAGVANAVGAAMAQVSGEIDQIFTQIGREEAIAEGITSAKERAVEAGALANTLTVVEVDDIPLSYLPGDARRIRVRVVGDIEATNNHSTVGREAV